LSLATVDYPFSQVARRPKKGKGQRPYEKRP
jgi:hypothetical protein